LNRVEDVQEEWRRGRTKEWDFKEGVKSKGFRAGQDTSLPEARSRRRDDGSGQAAIQADGTDHAHTRLVDLILFKPHQVAVSRRPRTEARPRRNGRLASGEMTLDNSRPVTEAWITTERNLPDNQRAWRTRLTQSPCCVRQPKWGTDSGFAQLLFVRCLNLCHSSIQAIDTRNAW
jgi:hypothetical protein